MKRIICTISLLFIVFLAVASQAQSRAAISPGPIKFDKLAFRNAQRTVLGDNIVHYRFDVAVGRGQYDVIRLHRVIKEVHPYQPVRTVDGILLLPGIPNYFESIFMEPTISQVPAWDHSIAVFLAKNDVDVWGMDYGWALVPAEIADFNFMETWGVVKDSQHTEVALTLARWLRGIGGQGSGPLYLLGFSYGGFVTYSVAGEETQWPRLLRNVKGIVPVDLSMKYAEQPIADYGCGVADSYKAQIDQGVYNDDTGLFVQQLSQLAISAPTDDSPILPGLTNFQVALFFGSDTWLLDGNLMYWHFVGGYLDENGTPSDLRYTDSRVWLDVIGALPPHAPVQAFFDTYAVNCSRYKVSFDDHLRNIAVPILYVGAGGGEGEHGYHTTSLTASKDITEFTVKLQSDDQRMIDAGHVDIFAGTNADSLFWKPILDWIVAHR